STHEDRAHQHGVVAHLDDGIGFDAELGPAEDRGTITDDEAGVLDAPIASKAAKVFDDDVLAQHDATRQGANVDRHGVAAGAVKGTMGSSRNTIRDCRPRDGAAGHLPSVPWLT